MVCAVTAAATAAVVVVYSHFTSNGRQYCPFSAFDDATSIDVYLCLLQASTSLRAATLYELISARPSTESTAMKIPLLRLINLIECDKANESRISTQQKVLVPPHAMTMVPPLSSTAQQQNNNNNNRNSIAILHTDTHSQTGFSMHSNSYSEFELELRYADWVRSAHAILNSDLFTFPFFFIAPSLLRSSILLRAMRMCSPECVCALFMLICLFQWKKCCDREEKQRK